VVGVGVEFRVVMDEGGDVEEEESILRCGWFGWRLVLLREVVVLVVLVGLVCDR